MFDISVYAFLWLAVIAVIALLLLFTYVVTEKIAENIKVILRLRQKKEWEDFLEQYKKIKAARRRRKKMFKKTGLKASRPQESDSR